MRPFLSRSPHPRKRQERPFSEALVFETLIEEAATDGERLNLIAARIDDAMGNVFLTLAYFNAETAFHTRYRLQGELTARQYSDLWATALTDIWGDTMTLDPTFRLWWSFIPHMIESPPPEVLTQITDAILAGTITVPIAASYPLEQIRDAVTLQATRHARGKIVIRL